ncbi:hypothetical protein Gpo141_00013921 [Globisporangium polare]
MSAPTTQSPWKQLSPPVTTSQADTNSTATSPRTMQQIMDEELARKLFEDECKAQEARVASDAAVAQELAALEDEDDIGDSDYEQEQAQDEGEDDEDDYDDYMDSYSVSNGKSVQMIGQYVPLASSTKGFNSLRENMRRQEKGDTRKGPTRSVLDSGKFASKDSAFDERTRMVLLKLMNRGKLDAVHERINTGREANTYRAVGSDAETGRELQFAVKLFKTSRGDFTKLNECDPSGRVYNENFIKKTLRRQLKEWTEKEYKNLLRAASCGVQAPKPLLFKDHVLAMHFVGDTAEGEGSPAPKMRDAVLTKAQLVHAYVDVMRSVRTLYQSAQLVHARLSESNILYHDGRCWLVDFSEAMERSNPGHEELLDQDLVKIHAFFQGKGVRRVAKDALGMLSVASAKEFVTSEDPESLLKYYPALRELLFATQA